MSHVSNFSTLYTNRLVIYWSISFQLIFTLTCILFTVIDKYCWLGDLPNCNDSPGLYNLLIGWSWFRIITSLRKFTWWVYHYTTNEYFFDLSSKIILLQYVVLHGNLHLIWRYLQLPDRLRSFVDSLTKRSQYVEIFPYLNLANALFCFYTSIRMQIYKYYRELGNFLMRLKQNLKDFIRVLSSLTMLRRYKLVRHQFDHQLKIDQCHGWLWIYRYPCGQLLIPMENQFILQFNAFLSDCINKA